MKRTSVLTLIVLVCATTVQAFYSYSGFGNNPVDGQETWGAAGEPLLRNSGGYAYDDGISSPRSNGLPSARHVSNLIHSCLVTAPPITNSGFSTFVTTWGQFIDHDIDLTPGASGCPENFPIPIPTDDEFFNPTGRDDLSFEFCRSTIIANSAPRDQPNIISAFIDGSMIYGNSKQRSDALRSFVGGKLAMQTINGEEYPIYNDDGNGNPLVEMANAAHRVDHTAVFALGDERGNENPLLLSMHILFAREHNRWADQFQGTDEQIFQKARKRVIAILQSITYYEFLPALFGEEFQAYPGYDDTVNPGIEALFSSASYRFGHSAVRSVIDRVGANWKEIPQGNLNLFQSYFFPPALLTDGIDSILRGGVVSAHLGVDAFVVDAIRNRLFGMHHNVEAPKHASDLAAINIQRARDHGIPGYNALREAFGLDACAADDFSCVCDDPEVASKLDELYESTDDIDAWVGGLSEMHTQGRLGELFAASIKDQFQRLRVGDRFYFEVDGMLSKKERKQIRHTTLADVIQRNTCINRLPRDVFRVLSLVPRGLCPAKTNTCPRDQPVYS